MKTTPPMTFFAIVLLIFITCNFYVLWRLWHLIPASATALRVVAMVAGVVLSVAFVAGMAARGPGIPVWLASTLFRVGSGWTFIMLYLVMAFLLGDILRLVHLLPRGIMFGNWLTLGVLTGVMTVVFTAGNIIYHSKRRVEITLRADVGRPLTIVAASDLHLGFGIGSRELARWIEIINLERPDAVLFAGDAIDSSTRPLWSGDYAAVLRRLDAPSGVFAVPGNHEYISGVEESLRFLEQAGVRVLRDSVAMIADGVAVVGRDDASNRGRATVASLTAGLPEGVATILLDHQPLDLDEAADAGIDLQISGHTHRGQLWPATWITDRLFERSHGALQKGSTNYYITQGLGIWGGKFRLGSRSEYLVIRVRRRE